MVIFRDSRCAVGSVVEERVQSGKPCLPLDLL